MRRIRGLYCRRCGEFVAHEKPGTNNLVHFILTLVTCGLWIFGWLAAGAMSLLTPWRCTKCGKAKL